MRVRVGSAILSRIAKLRDLQCDVAAVASTKAMSAAHNKRAILEARLDEHSRVMDGWQTLIAAQSFSAEMLRYWSVEIASCDRAVHRAREELSLAEGEARRRGENWYAASRQRDLANNLLCDVRGMESRKREDTALQESIDRLVYQRSNP